MKNPLISESLSDQIEIVDGKSVYCYDCYNINICNSYGEISFACLAGANAKTRCSLGEKMQIRILNDSNPNAIYKPQKFDPLKNDD